MWTGTIESIHIASAAEATVQSVDQAQAIPGVGLEGDRYAKRQGTFFKPLRLIQPGNNRRFASEGSTYVD